MSEAHTPATVLVVEDNPINLILARELLIAGGYRVVFATSGEEAEQIITAQMPDLVLMDIRLPGVDGLTLVRRLRAEPSTANLPIIAVTAQAMAGDEAEAMAAGCDGYVSKPIKRAELLQAIERVGRAR